MQFIGCQGEAKPSNLLR